MLRYTKIRLEKDGFSFILIGSSGWLLTEFLSPETQVLNRTSQNSKFWLNPITRWQQSACIGVRSNFNELTRIKVLQHKGPLWLKATRPTTEHWRYPNFFASSATSGCQSQYSTKKRIFVPSRDNLNDHVCVAHMSYLDRQSTSFQRI